MVTIEQIAETALWGDALVLRALVRQFLEEQPVLSDVPPPQLGNPILLAVAAGLVELLAERAGQMPPAWTALIGPAPEPIFLRRGALRMPRLRAQCLTESPEPLKRRNIYTTANWLTSA